MMGYIVGVGVALLVGAGATTIGFDRDRAFYPTILVVAASYYDLFAAMGGSAEAFAVECVVLVMFISISAIGFRTSLWVVVAGLAGHGVLDLFHEHLVANPGVPQWWPAFCMAYDVTAAGYLAALLCSGRRRLLPSRESHVSP